MSQVRYLAVNTHEGSEYLFQVTVADADRDTGEVTKTWRVEQTITCRRGLEKVKKLSDYHRFVDTEELEEAAAGEIGRFLTEDAGLGDAGRDAEYVVVDKEGLKKRMAIWRKDFAQFNDLVAALENLMPKITCRKEMVEGGGNMRQQAEKQIKVLQKSQQKMKK